MAIRVKYELNLQISENSHGQKELGKTAPWSGTNDQQDNGGTWRQRVVAGETDTLVDLNGLVTGHLIAIKSDQEISIKKNSNVGEAWTISPLGIGATDGIFVITTDGVTSLYVTNAGSLDAEVTFSVAGVSI